MDLSNAKELSADQSAKVTLADGRALLIEQTDDGEHRGAFVGLVDKNGNYRDLIGVEQYKNWVSNSLQEHGPALVTHTWNPLQPDGDCKENATLLSDLAKSEAEEKSRLAWEDAHDTMAPSPEPNPAKEYQKAFEDLQDAMKRLYHYAQAPQMAAADIKHLMRNFQPKKEKQPSVR